MTWQKVPKFVRTTSAIYVFRKVRDLVRTKCAKCEEVTAIEALYFLESKNLITLNHDSSGLITQRERAAAIRNVQPWLLRTDFKRGKKNGKISLKPETISWRNSYIRKLLQNLNLPENER